MLSVEERPDMRKSDSPLESHATALLSTLMQFIESMPLDLYCYSPSPISQSSIGKHIRHSLDHFDSLRWGLEKGVIDYDQRPRDEATEFQPEVALARITHTLQWLRRPPTHLSKPIRLHGPTEAVMIHSSRARELHFVTSHLTHHMGIIRILAEAGGIKTCESFGKAVSTVTHERTSRGAAIAKTRRPLTRLKIAGYQVLKWRYFEFWPAWFFYFPLGLYYFLTGVRHLSFALPLYSNPGIPNSGVIGESKSYILSQIPDEVPEKLRFLKLDPFLNGAHELMLQSDQFMKDHGLAFPMILKPDIGQRGSGVVSIPDRDRLFTHLRSLKFTAILQEFCPYVEELGVNYVRYPNETQGKITGITRKRFPVVLGDGKKTLAALILSDTRARYLAPLYFKKHADRLAEVIASGEFYVLARIGNHCQGAIFEDGAGLLNSSLEKKMDQIAQKIPGFFMGRFDVRFESESALRRGERMKVIEINGAAGEATHIYDRKTGLFEAYAILFSQLRVLFEIGKKNRELNPGIKTRFWNDLYRYRGMQKHHPQTS